jgi:hypothetical protein
LEEARTSPQSVTQPETQSAIARYDKNEGEPPVGSKQAPPPQGGMGTHKNTVNPLALTREGGAPATVETNPQYSGFKEAIKRWGTGTETALGRELKCHKEVAGNTQRINQFKEVVGGLQDFRTYLFMKLGSTFAMVLHSPLKFVAINDATQHLQGKFVAFVGDRSARKDPTPIVLPPQKTWSWETRMVSTNTVALAAYYEEDPSCRGKLWMPDQATSGEWTPVKASLLLAVPLVLFQAMRTKGKPLMPHEFHGLTTAIISASTNPEKARTDWDLILAWCILAAHQNTYGNSHLSLAVEAVTEGDDNYFEKWIDQHLNSMFGPRPVPRLAGHVGIGGGGVPS